MESYLLKKIKVDFFGILDVTKTPMGGRTLRWMSIHETAGMSTRILWRNVFPIKISRRRLSLIGFVYDMERICAKISYDTVSARDFINLKESAFYLPEILEKIEFSQKELFDWSL